MTPLSRDLFAVTQHYTYLNHAATAVLPVPVRDALHAFTDAQAGGGIANTWKYEMQMPAYRERVASYINAQPGTIALLRNTSDGANVLAGGFPWQAGDEVLLPDDEFPANAQPWLALRKRGVNVRLVQTGSERLTPDVLRREITPRTKIVTVSWVSFHDGYRHDLEALAQVAHEAGALFCVDAIQGLGAFPIDVQGLDLDALYCGAQKWMLALQGISFLYVKPALVERLALAAPGWRSVRDMWDFLNYDQPLASDATKFEGGTPNFIGALSLSEAIDVLQAAGPPRTAAHILALTGRLAEGLERIGAGVLSHRTAATSSGIVTFMLPGSDPVALGKHLQAQRFVTTFRSNGIRVAPHGYNTEEEIDAFVEAVAESKKGPH